MAAKRAEIAKNLEPKMKELNESVKNSQFNQVIKAKSKELGEVMREKGSSLASSVSAVLSASGDETNEQFERAAEEGFGEHVEKAENVEKPTVEDSATTVTIDEATLTRSHRLSLSSSVMVEEDAPATTTVPRSPHKSNVDSLFSDVNIDSPVKVELIVDDDGSLSEDSDTQRILGL